MSKNTIVEDKQIIKRHNFEAAKERIKKFSERKPAKLKIEEVSYTGTSFFGELFETDHNVTGEEFNDRLIKIKKYLILVNNNNNKTVKEFGEVYNALEVLDKEYIDGILIAIKANEETSEAIKIEQERINALVNEHEKVISILNKFKEKIEEKNNGEDQEILIKLKRLNMIAYGSLIISIICIIMLCIR